MFRGDDGAVSLIPFSLSVTDGGIAGGDPKGGSRGENGVGGIDPVMDDVPVPVRIGICGGRRRMPSPSVALSVILIGVGDRRMRLGGTDSPTASELNVRGTESSGDSERLCVRDVAPATSSTHCRPDSGEKVLLAARFSLSSSARTCSRAASVALVVFLSAASSSRQASSWS